MFKILIFIHKTGDDKIINHFRDHTIKVLSEISNQNVNLAIVESNLLSEQKYSHFCEVVFNSKDEMERLMNSQKGLALNKDVMNFHQQITIISVNYDHFK